MPLLLDSFVPVDLFVPSDLLKFSELFVPTLAAVLDELPFVVDLFFPLSSVILPLFPQLVFEELELPPDVSPPPSFQPLLEDDDELVPSVVDSFIPSVMLLLSFVPFVEPTVLFSLVPIFSLEPIVTDLLVPSDLDSFVPFVILVPSLLFLPS